ncbi:hypothetical protein ACIQFU_32655 [Streptomyces sp. NPDC093065]|uniref:hypothetical protein n=1 Tax=Streptomyces sp. NPDC093065 TaxID=3366021 RepID=UPI003827B1B0
MLDHCLPRDGKPVGERRGGGLPLCGKQIKQPTSGRVGQRTEDAVDDLGAAAAAGRSPAARPGTGCRR